MSVIKISRALFGAQDCAFSGVIVVLKIVFLLVQLLKIVLSVVLLVALKIVLLCFVLSSLCFPADAPSVAVFEKLVSQDCAFSGACFGAQDWQFSGVFCAKFRV